MVALGGAWSLGTPQSPKLHGAPGPGPRLNFISPWYVWCLSWAPQCLGCGPTRMYRETAPTPARGLQPAVGVGLLDKSLLKSHGRNDGTLGALGMQNCTRNSWALREGSQTAHICTDRSDRCKDRCGYSQGSRGWVWRWRQDTQAGQGP